MLLCNVCKLVQTCKYGVTDISESASNVLYELGLMHANGVRCTILKASQATLFADIQGLFFLEYHSPETLSERLSHWIEDQVQEAERPSDLAPERLTRLLQTLSRRFDEGELQSLCFHLAVSYDDLPAQGKANKARELVQYLERRGRIYDLIRQGQSLRPDVPWQEI